MESGETKQLTKNNETYVSSIQWSPDGSAIYYVDRKNRFVRVDPASGKKATVFQTPEGPVRPVFSPDGKWISYTRSGENDMGIVYVYELSSGKEYPVTEKWYNSSMPLFSSDGKYLIFNSDRDLNPTYSRIEWNYAYTNMSGMYMVMLAKDTPSPFLPVDGKVEGRGPSGDAPGGARPEGIKPDGPMPGGPRPEAPASGGKPDGVAKPDGGKPDAAKPKVSVKIDPEGLCERMVKLPLGSGAPAGPGVGPGAGPGGFARPIYCDGKKLWYSSGMGNQGAGFHNRQG